MSLTYEQAVEQLHAWTETDSLRKHARAVEIAMRAAAGRYGGEDADAERWAIAGLVHDADYEKWPEDHPQRIVDWLREQGEEEIAYAVSVHQTKWGCLVRPDGVTSLTPKSVKKKIKDKAFAAKVDRDIIRNGVALLGVDLGEHVQFMIDALRPHAEELGIEGTGK